jgi:hypothetical protein
LPQGVGRGVETIAPETVADHHNRCVAGPVHCWTKHSSPLGSHAEHGKIIW